VQLSVAQTMMVECSNSMFPLARHAHARWARIAAAPTTLTC
jgi:hypothetical protein